MGQPLFTAMIVVAGVTGLANTPAAPSPQVDQEHGNISNIATVTTVVIHQNFILGCSFRFSYYFMIKEYHII